MLLYEYDSTKEPQLQNTVDELTITLDELPSGGQPMAIAAAIAFGLLR